MEENQLLEKVKRYKDLKNKISILEAEAKELNKELKDSLRGSGKEEFIIGSYVVKLQSISKDRFNSKQFKDENSFLYSKYVSTVNEERLQVTGGDIL